MSIRSSEPHLKSKVDINKLSSFSPAFSTFLCTSDVASTRPSPGPAARDLETFLIKLAITLLCRSA